MVTGDELRAAMGKYPTGVTVVTTLKGDGSVGAMTANSVTSISLEPPLVLLSVGHTRNTLAYIRQSGRFAINVLRGDYVHVAEYFATDEQDRKGEPPVEYSFTGRGMPRVDGCLSFVDCDVVDAHEHGDHTVFVGRVMDTHTGSGSPLVFFEGRYLDLPGSRESDGESG